MEIRVGQVVVHDVEHGTGRPVLVLHGAGADHREPEACFEPVLDGVAGLRRSCPDLPGMARTVAPETLQCADDVLDTMLVVADEVSGETARCSSATLRRPSRHARRPGGVQANRRTLGTHSRSRGGVRASDGGRGDWTRRSGMPPPPTSSITTRIPRSPWSMTLDTPYPTSNRNS